MTRLHQDERKFRDFKIIKSHQGARVPSSQKKILMTQRYSSPIRD